MPRLLSTLVVGHADSAEMRAVVALLSDHVSTTTTDFVPTLSAALQRLTAADTHFELGVVLQHHPDEFATTDAEALLAAAPLTRWIVAAGLWCESESRTGSTWPTAVRVPARLFAERLERELEVIAGRAPSLALTASREEAVLFDLPGRFSNRERCRVAVISPDRELRTLVHDVLQMQSCEIVPLDALPQVVVVDSDPSWTTDSLPESAGIVVLTNWPDPVTMPELMLQGIDVVPKLAVTTRLAAAVRSAVASTQKRA